MGSFGKTVFAKRKRGITPPQRVASLSTPKTPSDEEDIQLYSGAPPGTPVIFKKGERIKLCVSAAANHPDPTTPKSPVPAHSTVNHPSDRHKHSHHQL